MFHSPLARAGEWLLLLGTPGLPSKKERAAYDKHGPNDRYYCAPRLTSAYNHSEENVPTMRSNKKFTFLLCSLLCCGLLAGELKAQPPTLGVLAGVNFSTITGTDASARNRLFPAPHLGIYADWAIGPQLGFQPGILFYSRKGTNNRSNKFREDYCEFPLLIRYRVRPRIDLLAGPQLSLLYSARVNDPRGDITESIRSIDIGFVFGGRYQIDPEWNASLRFVPGLARVPVDGDQRRYNFAIQLSLGYILN